MKDGAPDIDFHKVLERVVHAKVLPEKAATVATQLIEKLGAPTRVSVLGHPLTGKTGVTNLLANEEIILDPRRLGTVKLSYGETERSMLQFADGRFETVKGLPKVDTFGDTLPIFTQIEAPLSALRKITLLQIGDTADTQSLQDALLWAAHQTDIAIWCTLGFSDDERSLWSAMPDELSDHAILLRTRCDEEAAPKDVITANLKAEAAGYFNQVIAISTEEAAAAKRTGEVNKDMLRASGAMKLISTILKDIDKGRQHLLDRVELLLAQNQIDPLDYAFDADEMVSYAPAAVSAPAPAAPSVTEAEAEATNGQGLPEAAVILFREAADRMQAVGRDLAKSDTTPEPEDVVEASADTLVWFGDRLFGDDLPDHPAVEEIRNMSQDANDLVQLMRIERDENSSIDATCLLLQVRRSLLSCLAA